MPVGLVEVEMSRQNLSAMCHFVAVNSHAAILSKMKSDGHDVTTRL